MKQCFKKKGQTTMTAWNAEETAALTVKCGSQTYDATGLNGIALVNKLKDIAKQNGISKFDVYDENGTILSPSDIENNPQEGTLKIERYNTAA